MPLFWIQWEADSTMCELRKPFVGPVQPVNNTNKVSRPTGMTYRSSESLLLDQSSQSTTRTKCQDPQAWHIALQIFNMCEVSVSFSILFLLPARRCACGKSFHSHSHGTMLWCALWCQCATSWMAVGNSTCCQVWQKPVLHRERCSHIHLDLWGARAGRTTLQTSVRKICSVPVSLGSFFCAQPSRQCLGSKQFHLGRCIGHQPIATIRFSNSFVCQCRFDKFGEQLGRCNAHDRQQPKHPQHMEAEVHRGPAWNGGRSNTK